MERLQLLAGHLSQVPSTPLIPLFLPNSRIKLLPQQLALMSSAILSSPLLMSSSVPPLPTRRTLTQTRSVLVSVLTETTMKSHMYLMLLKRLKEKLSKKTSTRYFVITLHKIANLLRSTYLLMVTLASTKLLKS